MESEILISDLSFGSTDGVDQSLFTGYLKSIEVRDERVFVIIIESWMKRLSGSLLHHLIH